MIIKRKNILICGMFFIMFSCNKKDENCHEKFQDFYLDRYALWLGYENTPDIVYELPHDLPEYSLGYDKLIKQTNDSLSFFIDCAIEQNPKNEILYLYKMKQLYLSDKLAEIPVFFEKLDKKEINSYIDFQLSLYESLSKELYIREPPKEDYKRLKKEIIDKKLNTENRTTEYFLNYLINNDKKEFINSIEKQTEFDISEIEFFRREDIIKNVMVRGDSFVFD